MSSGCWDPVSCRDLLCSSCDCSLGSTGSNVKMRCGTCVLGWKWSPQYLWGSSPIQRDMIFGASLVLGLPAPSLQDPHIRGCSTSVCRLCPHADSASGAAAPWEAPAGLRGQVYSASTPALMGMPLPGPWLPRTSRAPTLPSGALPPRLDTKLWL